MFIQIFLLTSSAFPRCAARVSLKLFCSCSPDPASTRLSGLAYSFGQLSSRSESLPGTICSTSFALIGAGLAPCTGLSAGHPARAHHVRAHQTFILTDGLTVSSHGCCCNRLTGSGKGWVAGPMPWRAAGCGGCKHWWAPMCFCTPVVLHFALLLPCFPAGA